MFFYRGKEFRTAFSKLGRLRALTNVPFMALTATANEEMQASIEESLNMTEPVVISRSVDRPNVYYSASTIKSIDVS
jgi:superfamily II DNA helicase RecQ